MRECFAVMGSGELNRGKRCDVMWMFPHIRFQEPSLGLSELDFTLVLFIHVECIFNVKRGDIQLKVICFHICSYSCIMA